MNIMSDNINFDFTEREEEIINLIKDGLTYNEMAKTLYITSSAVKYHVSHIIKKTKAVNTVNALYILLKNGYFKDTDKSPLVQKQN